MTTATLLLKNFIFAGDAIKLTSLPSPERYSATWGRAVMPWALQKGFISSKLT